MNPHLIHKSKNQQLIDKGMKNQKNTHCQRVKNIKKSLLISAFALPLFGSPALSAAEVTASVFAQRYELNLQFKNESVGRILDRISQQSGIKIVYSNEQVDTRRKLTGHIQTSDIKEALRQVLGSEYDFRQVDDYISVARVRREDTPATDSPQQSAQQKKTVTGVVVDAKGEPVIGANVKEKGTTNGVITDLNGAFSLSLPVGSTLQVSYIGYVSQEIKVDKQGEYRITLQEDSEALEEVVVVGYGTQKKVTVTGSVSTIAGNELAKSPIPNLSASLSGRVSGITTLQSSGEPGNDGVSIRVRGIGTLTEDAAQPLVLVDGIERSFDQINADEVESISILKDASATAVYGIRGANGVIIVTTKKGKDGPAKVSYTGNFSIQTPTRLPQFLNGYDFATLYNEAFMNDNNGAEAAFSTYELQKFKDGSDPFFYPNTDWLDMALKKRASQTQHTVNISGGTKSVNYFVSLGYLHQGGLFREFQEVSNISNNNTYDRFNFRSNIDIDVTSSTRINFQMGGYSGVRNSSKGMAGDGDIFFRQLLLTQPIASYGYYEGKVLTLDEAGGRYSKGANPLTTLTNGYADIQSNNLSLNLGIHQKLDFFIKGLSIRGQIAYDNNYSRKRVFNRNVVTYTPVRLSDEEMGFRPNGDITDIVTDPSMSYWRGRQLYMDWGIDYKQSFGNHNVSALLLYNQKKKWYHNQSYPGVPLGYQDLVGRLTYDYSYTYLFEFNIGRNGSENFPKENRFGWFPAVSFGWILTNEDFIKRTIGEDALSYMKIRASYGEVGNDKLGSNRFMYYPTEYLKGGGVEGFGVLGEDPKVLYGFYEGKNGNPKVTWERSKKTDVAVDMRFMRDRLNFTFDYFREKRNNILTRRNTVPGYISSTMQDAYNIGNVENKGYEIELGWRDSIHDLFYWINGNYSYSRNKIMYMDEIMNEKYPNLNRTGHRVGEQFGYIFDGFFNSEEEVNAAPSYFGKRPNVGDTKYKDITGDGVIDVNDQQAIGYPRFPEIFYGFSAGFSYKGFDFSILFQGATHASLFLTDTFWKPFNAFSSAVDFVSGRWHTDSPDNNANAAFPKLTINYADSQNYYNSTLNQKDASYLRLKNLEVGYTFSRNRIKKLFVEQIRLFISAQNLVTWDKLGIVDPESTASNGLRYPQLRTVNIGCHVDF